MKKILLHALLILPCLSLFSQITEAEKQLKSIAADSLMGWKKGGIISINTSQTSLTNWSAGGQSSLSVNGLISLFAHNKKQKSLWENYLDVGYGTVYQKETDWRKTDDRIDFASKYGLKATDKLYYAALVNFKTQMTNGYNYPNDSVKISGPLSPAYLLIAIGLDYIPAPDFTVFFAPLTYKLTMVKDNVLSDAGAFGVDPGEHTLNEFGGYLRSFIKKDLMENITIQSKLDLFSNYLEDFGNIDVSWETLLSMKVNEFISATFSTHLVYDHDITIIKENDQDEPVEYNSKVQFKEVLAVGLSIKF